MLTFNDLAIGDEFTSHKSLEAIIFVKLSETEFKIKGQTSVTPFPERFLNNEVFKVSDLREDIQKIISILTYKGNFSKEIDKFINNLKQFINKGSSPKRLPISPELMAKLPKPTIISYSDAPNGSIFISVDTEHMYVKINNTMCFCIDCNGFLISDDLNNDKIIVVPEALIKGG